jgi:hypothetical protein
LGLKKGFLGHIAATVLLGHIPVDLFGDKAEQAAELVNAGALVLVDGKLHIPSDFVVTS